MTPTLTLDQQTALERWSADPEVGTPVTADVGELLAWAREHAPLTGMQLFALLVGGAHSADTILHVVDCEGLATAAAVASNTVEAFVWDRANAAQRGQDAPDLIPDWRWRQLLNFAGYTVNGYPVVVKPRLAQVFAIGRDDRPPSGLTVGTTSLPLVLMRAHLAVGQAYRACNLPSNRLKGVLSQCTDEYGCLNSRVVLDASGVRWHQAGVHDADQAEVNPCGCAYQPLVNLGGDEDLLDLYEPGLVLART